MPEFEILKAQLIRAKSLSYKDHNTLDDILRKAKMALENLLPTKMYSIEIGQISFANAYIISMSDSTYREDWENGKNKLINLLDTAIQDYDIQSKKIKVEPKETVIERIIQIKDESAINDLKDDFRSYKKVVMNWSLFIFFSIVLSTLIWLYFIYSDWNWYNIHSKKIGVTLLLNLTVIIGLLNIPLRNNWLIWSPVLFGALLTLFTII